MKNNISYIVLLAIIVGGLFIFPISLSSCSNLPVKVGTMPAIIQIPLIDSVVPEKVATATFALGWFWGPDARFGIIEGVIRTRVGYAGGTSENPTYYNLSAHAETVEIDYDPSVVSYEELLNVIWEDYDTTIPSYSTQYRSVIFYHDDEQKMLAESWKQQWHATTGKELYVDIIPYKAFYPAEDYHQKYYLKMQYSPYQELKRIYPEENKLVNSTAAARINGYLAGYGTFTQLQQEINMYGLSEAGKKELLEIGRRRIIDTEIGDLCPVP